MKIIIDRFEANYAVCEKEDRSMINIDISQIPTNSREGDVLNIEDEIILVDKKATNIRQKHIEEITKDLWEN